jgi:hypothetical protein|tara:strand:+ start:807 stop:2972 length:2166 start_codon:yes stop_codon:yes gene_type:complete
LKPRVGEERDIGNNMLMQRKEIINKYWEAGFSLIPISRKKVPCLKGWQNTSVGQYIKESDFPENIGVVLQGDDLVIDVDPRHFKEGDNPFKRLKQDIGCDFKDTLVVETGRGGIHIYLKNPADTLLRASHPDYPGIDFKKKGGFVVAAGSIHGDTGKTYKIINGDDFNIMEAPSRLLELLMKDKVDFSNLQKLNGYCDSKQTISRFIERLKNTEYYLSGGSTAPMVFETACLGKDYGLSPQMALDLMNKHWNLKSGRSYEDIKYKVACAYKYGANPIGCANPRADFTAVPVDSEISVGSQEEWEDVIPFTENNIIMPDFPLHTLPAPGRDMVEAVSRINQVDTGLSGSLYLAALSASIAKKGIVDLGSHTETINLYFCPILESGERKSSTLKKMMDPIYRYSETIPETLIADDITTESLGKLMSENGERMAVISPEGGVFATIAGRYGDRKGNLDLYLKAHCGDYWSTHRIGRISLAMTTPVLTVCLCVQSDVIKEITRNVQFKGRGFLARILFVYCKSRIGNRPWQREEFPTDVKIAYHNHIIDLLRMPLGENTLRLTNDAENIFEEIHTKNEEEILNNVIDWSSKYPGSVARIAGMLHIAKYGNQGFGTNISDETMTEAKMLGEYYQKHSLFVLQNMRSDDDQIEKAKKILKYMQKHNLSTFTGRDVLRHKNCFKKISEINPGLSILLERNYIKHHAKGYKVNPRIQTVNEKAPYSIKA